MEREREGAYNHVLVASLDLDRIGWDCHSYVLVLPWNCLHKHRVERVGTRLTPESLSLIQLGHLHPLSLSRKDRWNTSAKDQVAASSDAATPPARRPVSRAAADRTRGLDHHDHKEANPLHPRSRRASPQTLHHLPSVRLTPPPPENTAPRTNSTSPSPRSASETTHSESPATTGPDSPSSGTRSTCSVQSNAARDGTHAPERAQSGSLTPTNGLARQFPGALLWCDGSPILTTPSPTAKSQPAPRPI